MELNKRPTPRQNLQRSLDKADAMMRLLEPVFERGDIDEEQFKQALTIYTQAVIVKARVKAALTLTGGKE